MTRYLKNQHTRDLMLKNPYTCNKRFNFLLNGMNDTIGTYEWDYFAREIEKTMKYIRDAFYKLPQVAFSASKGKESPWRVFGMSTPKYCFDGEVLHIDLNVPREVRHPDEYPSYHNNSDYDYTFKRIDEIESAVLDVADYIEEKGYKVDISAW